MRPIDADALFEPNESTDKVLVLGRSGGKTIALAEKLMRERVNMAPTLTLDDLRPKGRWLYHDAVSPTVYCSECRALGGMDCCGDYHSEQTPFCPSCGADMRGGESDA